jgi:hypothetical protein
MARRDDSFWYDLGRGIGTVISALPAPTTRRSTARSRARKVLRRSEGDRTGTVSADPMLEILTGGVTALVISTLRRLAKTRRPTPTRLLRGALAGAGAAGAVFAFRLLSGRAGRGGREGEAAEAGVGDVVDELLAGAGRGLIYATLLEPYLAGPPLLRGAAAGTIDYVATPLGGIFSSLQALSPVRRVPVISILLETGDAENEAFITFLAHGILLGLLYGEGEADASPRDGRSSIASRGTRAP